MKTPIQSLIIDDLDILRNHFETTTFNHEFNLIYEKQIPNTGIVLVNGEINLLNKKRSIILNAPGYILGLQNLVNNIPFRFKCRVKKNSQLILLPKSDIIKIINEKQSTLYKIMFPTGA